MKKITSKLIYALGLFTLFFGLYVSSFYLVSNKVIRPYEKANSFKTHSLRPVYNVLYYPMRVFIANGSSFHRDIPDQHVGTVEKDSDNDLDNPHHRSVNIDEMDGNLIMIGFTGKASTLRAFDKIEDGSYARFFFGRALTKEHDRFINRLIRFEIIDLMDDPRISDKSYSDDDRKMIYQRYNGLSGDKKNCATKFVSDYKEEVLDHCLLAGYARNIGGGCYHIVGYSVTTAVLEHALSLCRPKAD